MTRPFRHTAGAAIALAVVTTLSSCTSTHPSAPPQQEPSAPVPISGGVLNLALDTAPPCLDPARTTDRNTNWIARNALDSLVAQTPDHRFTSWLAKSWETSADGLTYTFHLRENVTFSDGTALDAAAVKFNLDRWAAGAGPLRMLLGPYAGSSVVESHTVKVTFSRPFTPFLQSLSTSALGIQSPKFLQEHAADTCQGLVGSGPFVLDTYVPNVTARFTRNNAYAWEPGYSQHKGPARLDGLAFTIVTDRSARASGLTKGAYDVVADVSPADVRKTPNDAVMLIMLQNPGINRSLLPNTRRAPFDDLRVRQAFQSTVNLAQSVKNVFEGATEVADGPFGPTTPYHDSSVDGLWGYDAGRAGKLLDDAGWKDRDEAGYRTKNGVRLTAQLVYEEGQVTTEEQKVLQTVVKQAAEAGFEVKLVPVAAAGDIVARGEYDLMPFSYVRAEADVARTVFSAAAVPPDGLNYARVQDATLEALLDKGFSTPEGTARQEIYQQIQQRIITQAYAVPTYIPFDQIGTRADIHDFESAADSTPLLNDTWKQRTPVK